MPWQPIKMPLALINSILPCWVSKYEDILRFYARSTKTVHLYLHQPQGPINCKIGVLLPTIRPLDDFQEPLKFHGHDY
jgi:hypothetical protein